MDLHPNAVFSWYALQVVGGQENSAAAHLAGRRFGVYLPVEVATEIVRGRKVTRRNPMFPGYVLVATPDIDRHWNRIVSTPGAIDILGDGQESRKITESEMARIHLIENTELAENVADLEPAYSGRKRRRRRSRRARIGKAIDRQRQISILAKELGLEQRRPHSSEVEPAWPGSPNSFQSVVSFAPKFQN